MARLRLSASARRDLLDIRAAGVQDFGASASEAHLQGFFRLFQLLRDQPLAGQERPEFELGIRSLSHRPHRILYRVQGDTVVIERILHQSRDVGRALGRRH